MRSIFGYLFLVLLTFESLQADFLRFEASLGSFEGELGGKMRYQGDPQFDAENLGYDIAQNTYAWVLFKHPLFIIPNIRLEYADISYNGAIGSPIEWSGVSYTQGSSELAMKHFDGTLYFNLLDNTFWTTIDLGVNIKYIQSRFAIRDSGGFERFNEEGSVLLPMAYTRVRVEIPMTALGLEGDVKYLKYDDTKLLDARIKIDYTFDLEVINAGVEIGYRKMQINVNGDDIGIEMTADLSVEGPYAGAVIKF